MSDRQDVKRLQVEIAERLQMKWLQRMEEMLDEGTITATDMATLGRLLMANGWNLDPSQLPKNLRDQLEVEVDPDDLEDYDVYDLTRRLG